MTRAFNNEQIRQRCRENMLAAVSKYEAAKRVFVDVRKAYTGEKVGADELHALVRASSDSRLKDSISDAKFFNAEAVMYAQVMEALK